MDFVSIRDLKLHDNSSTIRVRLLRIWASLTQLGDSISHANMLFIDKDGVDIEAIVRQPHVSHFLRCFREGWIYILSRFVVENHLCSHRVVPSDLRLCFIANTVVERLNEEAYDIPDLSFRFLSLDNFRMAFRNRHLLPDLAGRVVACHPTNVVFPGLPLRSKKIRLQLLEGCVVTIFFWDNMINEFENLLPVAGVFGQVLSITSLFIQLDEGEYVFTASPATKIYVDLHCPQIHGLLDHDVNKHHFITHLTYPQAREFSHMCSAIDLLELQLDINNMEQVYLCVGDVTELVTSQCPVTNSTVIHLTIVDFSGDVAVIFTSRHLRRIASAILPSDDLLHADFNSILHSLEGRRYELLVKVGPWNPVLQYCDMVLLKLFPTVN